MENQQPNENTASPGVPPPANGYAPKVGDRFHKPAGTYISPLDADPVPTPEHNAEVIAIEGDDVVFRIDGKAGRMERELFAYLAEKTIAAGSTLTRA